MPTNYHYGKGIASVSSANGVRGILIRSINGHYWLRVRINNDEFVEYDLRHSDLEVTIHDSDAAFYKIGDRHILDHTPETLGLKTAESGD